MTEPCALGELLTQRTDWTLLEVVRLWSHLLAGASPAGADTPPLRLRGLRLRGHLGLELPVRELMATHVETEVRGAPRLELDVPFMALYGLDGPLSPRFTERLLQEQDPEVQRRLREFLDIFNHRLLELWVLACFRPFPGVDLGGASGRGLRRVLCELQELPQPNPKSGLTAAELAPFTPLLMFRPYGLAGLGQLLRALVPWPVTVEGGVPRQVRLSREERSGLGTPLAGLAVSLVLGDRVWDASASLRVQVGPVPAEAKAALEPGGALYRRVEGLMELWCQDSAQWELELHLDTSGATGLCLSASAPVSRLGVDSWIGAPPSDQLALLVSAHSVTEATGAVHD